MKVKKIDNKIVLKYCAIVVVSLILANAQISNLNPFLFALFFATIYAGLNEKFMAISTIVCSVIVLPSLENFFVVITIVFSALLNFYIHKLIKKQIGLISVALSYLVGLTTFIYYNILNWQYIILYAILGLLSIFIFIIVLQVCLIRKNCFKLTLDESICFLFFCAIVGVGLCSISIFGFSIYRFVLMLIIFICVALGLPTLTYALTLSFSLGVALGLYSLIPVAEFVIVAMLASVFSMPHKFKIILISIIADVFIQYFFIIKDVSLFIVVLPIILAGIVFILIPNKWLNNVQDLVYVKKSELSSRNAINTTRKNLKKRMLQLSNVFLEMKQIHLSMTKKDLNKEELIAMLSREIMSVCCKDCLEKNRCTRTLGTDNKSNLETLLNIAVTKGKISLLDIPPALTNRCVKVNNLISLINRLNSEYKQYKTMMADVNNVKILLADQMGAVSKLLLDIGDEIDTNVNFDIAKENKIIAKLLSQNIQCKEVLLYTEKNQDLSAVLVIKGNNSYNPIIEKVVSETLKCPMEISKVQPLEETDFNSVELKKVGRYDCVFGLSSCNKSGEIECGDCHSIIRLNKNKFLLALCDGMGSGKKANKMSAMTLGLIENFYKVGFDNDVILESVNKLLAVSNQESYSTLDVCVLDLEKEIADFIKVGAPYGLIKREGNVEVVEGGALPIGALDSIVPYTFKTTISTKDIVLMATDGITDAFQTEEALIEFVSKLASTNPQTLADSILNEALRLNNMSAKDDMTVLIARTYLKK